MKRSELIFGALLIPVDSIMIFIAAVITYWLRFKSSFIARPVSYTLYFSDYISWILFFIPFFVITFAVLGLYQLRNTRSYFSDISKLFISVSSGFSIIIFITFFSRDFFSSRFFIGVSWALVIFFLVLGRLIISFIQQYLLVKKGYGVRRVLLIGGKKTKKEFRNILRRRKRFGYKVVMDLDDYDFSIIKKLVLNNKIDEIIVTDSDVNKIENIKLIKLIEQKKIVYKYIPNIYQTRTSNIEMTTLSGFPLVEIKRTPLEGWGRILKRIFDIIGSVISIIIFSPILIITAFAVKLTSKGPILADIPSRAGQGGKPFYCLKFRSMYIGAHNDQSKIKSERKGIFKVKKDPRITKIGGFIRKTSIDELPQFFNVLKGEMSLVGPRPHFVEEFKEDYKKVWMIKPGITGFPQINGRSENTFEDEIELDFYYIENWSLWLDLKILFKTPFVVLFKKEEAS